MIDSDVIALSCSLLTAGLIAGMIYQLNNTGGGQ